MANYPNKDSEFDHIQPVQLSPVEVTVTNFERAFRAFRAMVQKEKIISLYKEKQRYEKPSDKKRRKRNESIRKRFENDMRDKSFKKGMKTDKKSAETLAQEVIETEF